MKTLSVRPPWSELIVHGIKTIENRSWQHIPKQPPQWLAIHASQKAEPGCEEDLAEFGIETFTAGAIVGAAYWTGSYDRKTCPKKLLRNRFASGPVFLVFEKVVRIEPVPCKGRLGFWPCPEIAEQRIEEAIRGLQESK